MAETPRDEKTEQATSRRRREAREKGQVASSTEITTAVMLIGFAISVVLGGSTLVEGTGDGLRRALAALGRTAPGPGGDLARIEVPNATGLLQSSVQPLVPGFLLLILPVVAAGIASAYSQVGFQFAPNAVQFDPSKINPGKGFGRLFSMRSVVRTLMASGKIGLLVTVVASVTALRLEEAASLAAQELGPALLGTGRLLLEVIAAGILTMLLIAVFDLSYQRHQHEVDLRMTKKEVREEHRDTDGDPHVKARIRAAQVEMAGRRMMADVPDATVVITNPTHYAVALAYDKDDPAAGAPRVVAKGADEVALKIREVATAAGVPVVEEPPLARALFASAEIGELVPQKLFAAVASVLAYVYGLEAREARV